MMAKSLQTTLLLLLFAVIIFALWALPHYFNMDSSAVEDLHSADCLLNHGECSAVSDHQKVSLSISDQPLVSLKPLTFSAALKGIEAEQVVLDLKGKEMYMGINQTEMKFDSESQTWIATTELAVCTTGTMLWQADIKILPPNTDQPITATFEFEAK